MKFKQVTKSKTSIVTKNVALFKNTNNLQNFLF